MFIWADVYLSPLPPPHQDPPDTSVYEFSSAVGQPLFCMARSSLFAIKHVVQSALQETGKDNDYFSQGESPPPPWHLQLDLLIFALFTLICFFS